MAVPTFHAAELAAATGGVWRGNRSPSNVVRGVVTDTRRSATGALFLALVGERFDAHDFLRDAISGGCAALCIEKKRAAKLPPECSVPVLEVDDTLMAYRDIAHFHRLRFPSLRLVAVTGSVGKTSVKEMLRAIFERAAGRDAVLHTEGNTNNQVGVPQNLLRLEERHRYAVIEAGTNHPGEIEPLSRCAAPQIGLINSIAPCHLEFLGSLAGVAREKAHLFDGLPGNGCAVIPRNCPEVEILEKAAEKCAEVLRFGETLDCDVTARYLGGRLTGSCFELTFPGGERFTVEWPLAGRHQAVNAAAAACAALAAGISPAVIMAGLADTRLPGMRTKITELGGVTYVNDAYNANPGSMRASFDWLAEFADPEKLILALGEMRELGRNSAAEHAALLELARRTFPGARILTVGGAFAPMTGVEHFTNAADAAPRLAEMAGTGDLVFAKGSRGIAMELALPEAAR